MTVKILSWNIWCDCDFAKVSDFLRASNADIIGLQEIVPGDTERDVVGFLSKLGYNHAVAPMGATFPDGRMITTGTFSKYPIAASTMIRLSEASSRQAVKAVIDIGGKPLTVLSVHLKHTHQKTDDVQNEQADTVMQSLPKERVIVMGDFNATPEMSVVRRMREALVDTDPSDIPTLNPMLFDCPECDATLIPQTRLDYIFVSKDLPFHSFKVATDAQGSDHLPVLVLVEL